MKYTLDPWVIRWEQAMNKALLLDSEKRDVFTKFNVDGLPRRISHRNGGHTGAHGTYGAYDDLQSYVNRNRRYRGNTKSHSIAMLDEVKEHTADDKLLQLFIAAVSYAESYQHLTENFYTDNPMPPTTEQAVIMLSSHFYESRDGSTGGFFADNVQTGEQVWNTVNLLLRLDRDWKV